MAFFGVFRLNGSDFPTGTVTPVARAEVESPESPSRLLLPMLSSKAAEVQPAG